MSRALLFVRSSLFLLIMVLVTLIWTPVCLLVAPLPYRQRYWVTQRWNFFIVWLGKVLCGMRYEIRGLENLPDAPAILLSKHQSAWETMGFQLIFPPQVWVLKKELLRVPFFGWGLAMLSPIAIDRSSRRQALQQLVDQGRQRLAAGFYIVIFPEGTRIAPGKRGKYRAGGARLAVQTGTPVLPVAHNAGLRWGKNAFLKYPGMITVSIGPLIQPDDNAESLTRRVEDWIENEMPHLDTR